MLERLATLEAEPFTGTVVILRGLVGATEHNGKRAAVRGFSAERGRFELKLLVNGATLHPFLPLLAVAVGERHFPLAADDDDDDDDEAEEGENEGAKITFFENVFSSDKNS